MVKYGVGSAIEDSTAPGTLSLVAERNSHAWLIAANDYAVKKKPGARPGQGEEFPWEGDAEQTRTGETMFQGMQSRSVIHRLRFGGQPLTSMARKTIGKHPSARIYG
jgi:hypothetical protein